LGALVGHRGPSFRVSGAVVRVGCLGFAFFMLVDTAKPVFSGIAVVIGALSTPPM